jgi:hypothetical protein
MAELLALGAAARLAVAAFSKATAVRDIAPELKALQLRVLAAATSIELAGPAFERDARVAPLVRTLDEATAWVERRQVKEEVQNWLHRAIMSDTTKAEIVRLDNELTKCASMRTCMLLGRCARSLVRALRAFAQTQRAPTRAARASTRAARA